MNNVVLSTRNIDDLVSDIANEVVKRIELIKKKPPESDEPLNIKEASSYLSLAVPSIYSLVQRQEIPFYKRPGTKRLYFSKKELLQWVMDGRRQTTDEIKAEALQEIKNQK